MNNNNQYTGHRKRLRTKFKKSGTEGLHDYEQLELLLTYSVKPPNLGPPLELEFKTNIN
jgi:DNA repair protein RadC